MELELSRQSEALLWAILLLFSASQLIWIDFWVRNDVPTLLPVRWQERLRQLEPPYPLRRAITKAINAGVLAASIVGLASLLWR